MHCKLTNRNSKRLKLLAKLSAFLKIRTPFEAICYIIIYNFLLLSVSLSAQSIPCDGAYYLFLTPSSVATTSAMYRVTTNTTTQQPVFELINPSIKHRVTAAGYSVLEQKIYALDYNTFNLLRIDAKGNVEVLPVPLSLDTTNLFFAGEVSPGGGSLLVAGRDKKTMRDQTLFSIRLTREDYLAGRVSILSDFGAALEDMAFDPVRGTFYGYDGLSNKLVWVDNLSGRVTDYFSRNMSGVGLLGSLFFDRSGQLHAYGSTGSNEENTFFNIDKLIGKSENLAQGPRGRFSDGCACPYTIRAYKTVMPRQMFSCNEVTITYDLINHAGTAYSYISLNDTFPSGFVITKILKTTRTGEVVSGVGSNILSIKGIDLILDTNRVVVTLGITDAVQPGNYANQAVLQELPAALGGKIYSDDPATAVSEDATTIEVIGKESKGKFTKQQFLCNGEGVLLETTVPNASYKWSNGATEASIVAQKIGWYAVTITADCGEFVDSLYVTTIAKTLKISLEPKRSIELGEEIQITPVVSDDQVLTYQWQALDGSSIGCPVCKTLIARPFNHTIYKLLVTDENGCTASDTVAVQVIPVRNIFAPTAFSPNNDGVNDVFYLQGKSDAKILYLRIFDRWGNQVFQVQNGVLNDQTFGWDGKVNSKMVSNQAFIYVAELEFPDGVRKRLSGEVALIK